jgi:hypothetical protein
MNGRDGEFVPMAVFAVLFMLAVGARIARGINASPFMVLLDSWHDTTPDKGTYVRLSGRPAGFLSWLRALFGAHTEVSFEVTTTVVQRSYVAWNSVLHDAVPLENIGSCRCGFRKNGVWLAVAAAGVFGLISSLAAGSGNNRDAGPLFFFVGFASFIAAIVGIVAYVLSKRLEVAIETGGGRMIGIEFQPSSLGGATFSRDDLEDIMHILTNIATRNLRARASR